MGRRGSRLGALGRWRERVSGMRAGGRAGDVHALDREGDPRGGVQSEDYRSAGPTDVVADEGVVMSGPGGAPQEGRSVDERRRLTDEFRAARRSADPEPKTPEG